MENNIKTITKEEAIKLLIEDNLIETDFSSNDSIFDAYGNYNYPSDAKIEEPNIATGYIF